MLIGRSPRGERGLKCNRTLAPEISYLSLSSRRAWIEINFALEKSKRNFCRSPRGERGLKLTFSLSSNRFLNRRSPRGERGLKLKY